MARVLFCRVLMLPMALIDTGAVLGRYFFREAK